LAELGAFAALKTVAPSLLAVLDDYFYSQVSFIRNGPVRYLENAYGEEWILVLDRREIGIVDNENIAGLNIPAFSASIIPAVNKRLSARSAWSNLDMTNSGHAILLMTGLCQEFGALTIREIRDYLQEFGINEPRLDNYIYCAQLLGWIKRVRKGNNIYYVAEPADSALDYKMNSAVTLQDKLRWRTDIRTYWRKNDGPRLRAIADVVTPALAAQ
jgi:hypothetical protein